MGRAALIVVDVQRDFCQGGALAVSDTLSLLEPLVRSIQSARRAGAVIVFTQDWHPANHSSFQTYMGPWPVHCVAESAGAELMPPLRPSADDLIIHKGETVEGPGYSGFEHTGLANRLKTLQVDRLGVSGIATEYCVRATALDGLRAGFDTVVLDDLIRSVNPVQTALVLEELKQAGVGSSSSSDWLAGV